MTKQFSITENEYDEVLTASQSVTYLIAGGTEPSSPQENANRVWQKIALKYGVDWLSIRQVAGAVFTGTAKEPIDDRP